MNSKKLLSLIETLLFTNSVFFFGSIIINILLDKSTDKWFARLIVFIISIGFLGVILAIKQNKSEVDYNEQS